jgi:hypothetical protein
MEDVRHEKRGALSAIRYPLSAVANHYFDGSSTVGEGIE